MLFLISVLVLIVTLVKKLLTPSNIRSINKKHVIVTGGSSGIGKSVAILAARKGAHVTIAARNVAKLSEAKKEIEEARKDGDQVITTVSLDVSDKKAVNKEFDKLEETVGPIYMLINCAGMAICSKVEDYTEETVKTLIDTNYLGTLYIIQNVVPKFKKRKDGIIVITGALLGLMGMFGLSVYSSCKFALRGLAESIHMELKPYNVSVTLVLPPDTDTPGFEKVYKTKLEETYLSSQSGGLFGPEVVAKKLFEDALVGNFFSYVGYGSCIIATLCVGMAPFASLFEVLIQAYLMGPLRLVSAYYITSFHNFIQKCHLAREENK